MVVKIDKVKIPTEVYRYIEHELYHYAENKKLVCALNKDLADVSAYAFQEKTSGGRIADLTYLKSLHLCNHRRLLQLERNLAALERALAQCGEDAQAIFRLQYLRRLSWQRVAMQIHLEQATYYRRRRELVFMYGLELGLLDEELPSFD